MSTFREVAATDIADLRRRQALIENRRLDIAAAPADPVDLADTRAKYDGVYSALGAGGAPGPLPYESAFSYRRRLASKIAHLSPSWAGTNVHDMPRDAMNVAEREIISEAHAAVDDHSRGNSDGSLRLINRSDNGHGITDFAGNPLSWMRRFMAPGQTVRRFQTPGGQPIVPNRRSI